jgi:ligand-binding sensor domain-containing protein
MRPQPPAFVHEAWTTREGMPVDAVTDVLQGREGYLWLATFDGLARFDGVRFTVFSTSTSDVLPSNRLVALTETPDGSLYVRTEQQHLVRSRRGVFTHLGNANGLLDRSARVTSVDAAGRLLVGTDHGVRVLDAADRFVPVAPAAIRAPVDALLHDAAGVLWVGTTVDGLYRVQGDRVAHFRADEGLRSPWVTRLAQGTDGTVWVGTDAGVHRVVGGRVVPVDREDGRPLRARVLELRASPTDGAVWVSTEAGLFVARGDRVRPVVETPDRGSYSTVHFDASGEAWYAVDDRLYRGSRLVFEIPPRSPAERRPVTVISGLASDREGSVWIATRSHGLFRLKPALFRVLSDTDGLPGRNVNTVIEDRGGAIWAGTRGAGLARIAGDAVTAFPPGRGVPAYPLSLLQTRDGALWVGTLQRGIVRCRLPDVACGDPPGGQPAPDAMTYAMHQDSTGALWAGTDAGLFRLRGAQPGGTWERMRGADGAVPTRVRAFLAVRDGTLWMGTAGAGLLAYRDGRFTRLTTAEGLPIDLVRSLYEDAHGHLWVGTEGRGLARVTAGAAARAGRPEVRSVRQRDGLFDEVIHQILPDGAGRLWMSTNRGIFSVRADELDAFAEGRAARVHSTVYSERDGLRNREANGGYQPAGVRARDGRLWFPTQDGVAVVDPARVGRNPVPPPVVVERLVARDRPRSVGGAPAELGPAERDFQIEYTALSFVAPENVRFRYRLDGFDAGGWRRARAAPRSTRTCRRARTRSASRRAPTTGCGTTAAPRSPCASCRACTRRSPPACCWRWRSRCRRGGGVVAAPAAARPRARAGAPCRAADRGAARPRGRAGRQNAQLEVQARRLTELDEAKSRLFANLSHEFRTPLTLILGPLRGLLDGRHGALSDGAREQGALMLRNGQRLLRLINQILDLAKLQAGQLALDRRPHDLVAIARDATLAFAPLAERRAVTLRFAARVEALVLPFDDGQLEKVLLNLLSNALKFTESGGSVDVEVRADGSGAELRVRDTGVGIAPDELPRIFDRFHQVDARRRAATRGRGSGWRSPASWWSSTAARSASRARRARGAASSCGCPGQSPSWPWATLQAGRSQRPISPMRARAPPTVRPRRGQVRRRSPPTRTGPRCWWSTTTPTCARTCGRCSPPRTAWSRPTTGRRGWRPPARRCRT